MSTPIKSQKHSQEEVKEEVPNTRSRGRESSKDTPKKGKSKFPIEKEENPKSKSPQSNTPEKSKPRKRLKKAEEKKEDTTIDVTNKRDSQKSKKGDTPEEYFEKFATKAKPEKSPIKETKAPPKRKKKVDSDEEYNVNQDLEEIKELEACVDSESLDISGIVESSEQLTEKVIEVKTKKRTPDQVKNEKEDISKKVNVTFDEKKKQDKSNTPKKNSSLTPVKEEKDVSSKKKTPKKHKKSDSEVDECPDEYQLPSDPLKNYTFCITGVTEVISRDRLEEFLTKLGARVTSAISGKTSYLIVGAKLEDGRDVSTSAKYSKAIEKKTPILTEEDLQEFLRKEFKNKYFSLDNTANWNKPYQSKKIEIEKEKANIADTSIVANKEDGEFHKRGVLLTDKYRPVTINDLVGNKGEIQSLHEWLKDWDDVHIRGNKKQINAVRGNWQNAPRVNAKAAIVSGPPGIGKTSTARILCATLGFEVLELNASDTRNKKTIEKMIGDLSKNNSIDYYTKDKTEREENKASKHKKSVIIMDEVDGCGAGDRGGISALIQVIKMTKTPIICICNDIDSQKVISLKNHCLEIKFVRPSPKQIINRIMQISKTEGLDIEEKGLQLLIDQSGCDIRQVITQIQMILNTCTKITYRDISSRVNLVSKDHKLMINPFQAVYKLLLKEEHEKMTFRDKLDMFYLDYNFTPLLVQENYLTAMENNYKSTIKDTQRMANAAALLSLGDTFDNKMRSNNEWTLLQDIGFCMAVAPCYYSQGSLRFTRFPEWLGKNSTKTKSKRLINELKVSLGHRAQCNRTTLLNDYLPVIFDEVFNKLKNENYDEAIGILDELNITSDQFKEHVISLLYDKKNNRGEKLEKLSKDSKTAFTKTYNSSHKSSVNVKKTKKTANVEKDLFNPDIEEDQAIDSSNEGNSEVEEVEIVEVKQGKKKLKKGKEEEKGSKDGKSKKSKKK